MEKEGGREERVIFFKSTPMFENRAEDMVSTERFLCFLIKRSFVSAARGWSRKDSFSKIPPFWLWLPKFYLFFLNTKNNLIADLRLNQQ